MRNRFAGRQDAFFAFGQEYSARSPNQIGIYHTP